MASTPTDKARNAAIDVMHTDIQTKMTNARMIIHTHNKSQGKCYANAIHKTQIMEQIYKTRNGRDNI